MKTFTFKDLAQMYQSTETATLQQEILYTLQQSEDFEMKCDSENIYEYFDAQFDDFDLTEDEIKDPSLIINATRAQKKEAAVHLHKTISLMLAHWVSMPPHEKEKLKIRTMMESCNREQWLKDVAEYCSIELSKSKTEGDKDNDKKTN